MALTRLFPLSSRQHIEIRAEAFNVFNWFNWGQPSTALNSATFGQITSSAVNSTRIVQLAAKYAF